MENHGKENHCHKNCGVAKTLKVIGSKWSMLILHNLFKGSMRFGELQRALEGISPKTLSIRLTELEQEGIVKKTVYAEVPLHVEYNLTAKGMTLKEIFNQMASWGEAKSNNIPIQRAI